MYSLNFQNHWRDQWGLALMTSRLLAHHRGQTRLPGSLTPQLLRNFILCKQNQWGRKNLAPQNFGCKTFGPKYFPAVDPLQYINI